MPAFFLSAALLFGLLSAPWASHGNEPAGDDVDPIGLAALLIRDGHYERAQAVLEKVDETKKDVDPARLYTLRGLVRLHARDLAGAKEAFRRAVAEGQADPIVHVYLAQVHYGLREYRNALVEIDAAGDAALKLPEMILLEAQCHWELGEKSETWRAIAYGADHFPGNSAFLERKIFLLIEMKLYQEAAALGSVYLGETGTPRPESLLAIGNALRRGGQLREAARFMEAARLRTGSHREMALELAHVYLDMGSIHAAAAVLEEAAGEYPDLAGEAAELYRKAGQSYRALILNARVQDQGKKLKQRLALLLELERYDQAAALADPLYRVGLLNDEDIRYALAYAYFKTSRYENAEAHLARLTRPDLFRKAAEIRKAMDQCRNETWRCY